MWFTCETFQAHVLVQSSNLHISEENTVAMCLYVCVLLFRMLCICCILLIALRKKLKRH